MQSDTPPVSVIICTYSLADDFGEKKAKEESLSRSEMLRISLLSLKENTNYPIEVIVIDNGGDPDDSGYLLDLTRKGTINVYVRNKENMYFGFAWNQGASLATSEYLCFTCNDIKYNGGWIQETIHPLLKYPERRLIATPIITPDKTPKKYDRGSLNGYRLNSLAGSNCMLMHFTTYQAVGEFSTHRIAGTHWHHKMSKMGYTIVAPPLNKVEHLASKGGVDFNQDIKVKETLLDGTVLDFSTP